MTLRAVRGTIVHCLRDPGDALDSAHVQALSDGMLVIEDGHIVRVGPATELLAALPAELTLQHYPGKLIVPGFIDTHIHFVQTDIIASYGGQLLQWLEKYTFPAERAFADPAHAHEVAEFFVGELLRNGTTTALVLGSVHAHSADAVFAAAQTRDLRLIAGKVLMDRNCPADLRDTPERGYAESRALIERWHGRGRLGYAITPRFAPTSTPAQLARAGALAHEFPEVHVHTHLAENLAEVAWVRELFPDARSYLDVYDRHGLMRERAVYAHSIHLDDADRARFADSGAAVAFCPTCNLFIGSGLFDLRAAWSHRMRVGLGTDIGGGTTFSMLQVLSEAYKVAQLRGFNLSPFRALYLATLAGAEALRLEHRIGNFTPGKEADFLVLDPTATPLLARRTRHAGEDIADVLFALMMLGDDRCIERTYVLGREAHARGGERRRVAPDAPAPRGGRA